MQNYDATNSAKNMFMFMSLKINSLSNYVKIDS